MHLILNRRPDIEKVNPFLSDYKKIIPVIRKNLNKTVQNEK